MPDIPDLTAELDAAEAIVMGRAEAIVTEWGVRYDDLSREPADPGLRSRQRAPCPA